MYFFKNNLSTFTTGILLLVSFSVQPTTFLLSSQLPPAEKDVVVFNWHDYALLPEQQVSMPSAWKKIFCCGCCMDDMEEHNLKKQLIPSQTIQVLQAATKLAQQIIEAKTQPIIIKAHKDACAIACLATKLLEPEIRLLEAAAILLIENAVAIVIGIRVSAAEGFKSDVKGSNWNFTKQFEKAHAEIQSLIPNNTIIQIDELSLIDHLQNIPEIIKPSKLIVKSIKKDTHPDPLSLRI